MLFKKKKKEEEGEEDIPEVKEEDSPAPAGDMSIGQMTADLEKLKAKFSTFYEINKASTERFTRINEQIGELRSMMLERDKESRTMEAKATQAIDLVQSVQPDKLMVELKKMDNKIEILKSNLESNGIIMNNTINELKDMRLKIKSFKGIEESIKLGEEVKKEWLENKKIDANITKHATKVETIYSEMWKKFSGFEKFSSVVADLDKSVKQVGTEIDSIKVKIPSFSDKKEIEKLMVKLESFEKYTNNVLSALQNKISTFEKSMNAEINQKMEKAAKLLKGFETLAIKTPDLDKYFNLLEAEAKKSAKDVKVEKIKAPGQEEKIEEKPKEGILDKIRNKIKK